MLGSWSAIADNLEVTKLAMTRRSTVVGVFDDSDRARDAINALKDAGFNANDIGILMKDREQARDMAGETGSRAGEGAVSGAIGGGILGGLAGWLVGVGALAIPGVGPFIAAGAFGAALAGAGIGAGVGAIAGALVGMGIPQEEADWYEGEIRQGRTLVTVKADGRYSEAREILSSHGAYDIENRYAGTGTGTTMGTTGTTSTMSSGMTSGSQSTGYTGSQRWEDVSTTYRNRFQQRYGSMGGSYRWEDYEPGYRYGWEMHNRPEYRDRSWSELEPDFRRDWERRHSDKPWDRFMDAIKSAWEGDRDTGRVGTTYDREQRLPASEDEYEIIGGLGSPSHEHRWVSDRCEICGATRRFRRAA